MPARITAAQLGLLVGLVLVPLGCGTPNPAPTGAPTSSGASCPATAEPAPASIPDWEPSAQDPTVIPIFVSSSGALACGPSRFVFTLIDRQNLPVAAPDRSASVAFYDLGKDPGTPVATHDGTFVWAIEGARGVYVVETSFTSSGLWGAEFKTAAPGAPSETIRAQFEVRPAPLVVSVGERAPASDTLTLADVGGDVTRISTDPQPVQAFYQTSIADAVAAGKPFALVFATPKFCASAQCGPTLDRIKPIAAAHPELTVINVEPYELQDVDGQLQPVLTDGSLTPTAATNEWRLLSEPWVFVVDGSGIVRGSFEGIFGDEELERSIAAVIPAS
ncbi:MAG: hypothetical protein WKF56_02585 [Candidatus Limnocylindrales bacterium]